MNRTRPLTLLLTLAAIVVCAVVASPASAAALRASVSPESTVSTAKAHAAGSCGDIDAEADQTSAAAQEDSTVCLLNRERTSRGLHSLSVNRRLSAAAQDHSDDMVHRRYFAHSSRSGSDVVDRLRGKGYMSGARSWMVGENLAWGSGTRSTPRNIVSAWMHSPGHRHNILTARFREIGIGLALRAPVSVPGPAATYTTTFGARS